jgi:hypothetical protein
MKEEWMEVLSALVDGEDVADLALLAEALAAAEGREALLEFVRLRTAVRADESRPRPQFYEKARAVLGSSGWWHGRPFLRGLAAAVVFALGTAGLVDLGFRLHGDKAAEQPPHATRVLRFEPGVDWQTRARQ